MYFSQEYDVRYISDLLNISEKLAITPPRKCKGPNVKKFRYHSIAVAIIMVIGCSCSLFGKIMLLSPRVKSTSAFLGIICDLTLCLFNLTTILTAVCNIENWKIFLNLFLYIDKKLNNTDTEMTQKNLLHLQLLMYHCLIIFIFSYDGYVIYKNFGWAIFKCFLFGYVQFYHCFISTLIVLHFASALRQRFRRINNLLAKSSNLHSLINNFIPKNIPESLNNIRNIQEVSNYYMLLSELVDLFNKLFGWHIFLMTENIILLMLDSLNSLTLNMDLTQTETATENVFLASFSIMLIVFHSRVIVCCEGVNYESRNTLNTCYNLQQTVNPMSEDRKELIILSDIVNLLQPQTNAAGFYFINRSLLSRVFSCIFSYLIVFIQFNKQT